MDTSNPGKVKSYKIRYKGDTDGFITELEFLPGKLWARRCQEDLTQRKPNQESLFEQIAENPWAQRGAVLAVAGLGVPSYLKTTAGAVSHRIKLMSKRH